MADENNSSTEQQQQAPDAGNTPGPVPYERFKEVNDKAKTLEQRLKALEAQQAQQQQQEMAEQNRWKELAEQREQELRRITGEHLRTKVAASKGLPLDLAGRLQGSTEEEIAADADALLAFVKAAQPQQPSTPGVPPASRNGQPAKLDVRNMTPAEIRENKDRLIRQ